jgi:hypothetical protein
MIAITLECNDFIATYEVIAMLFIQLWFLHIHFYKGLKICLASRAISMNNVAFSSGQLSNLQVLEINKM